MTETQETYNIAPTKTLNPQAWEMLRSVGEAAYESRKFGLTKFEGEVKMAVAYEFGVPITTALSSVYVIDKKPVLAPKLLWARAQAHSSFEGYTEQKLMDNGKFAGWSISIKRKGMPEITREFTMDQARAIGLATKDNWKNYPEDVCYWRTIDRVLHVAFADVCMGLYAADELGMDITPDGEVVESQWAPVEPEPVLAFSTIDALLTQWTAEQIVVANEGKIPSTVDECQQVTEILNG